MAISDILASIDHDIAQLQQAHALLSGGEAAAPKKSVGRPKKSVGRPKKSVGRPKKVVAVAPAAAKPAKKRKKRKLSPEGRKRIAEAVKKRWAALRAAASK